MYWRSLKTLGSFALVGLVTACGMPDEKDLKQSSDADVASIVERVSDEASTEWIFRNAAGSADALRPGTALGLFTTYDKSFLKYASRSFGINLSWTKSFLANAKVVRANTRDHRTLRANEPVALHIQGGGYVKYERRDWGINLAWSSSPVFEWELRGPVAGSELALNQKVRLYNRVANDNVIYCWRETPTVNLTWTRDCYVVGGRRTHRPNLP